MPIVQAVMINHHVFSSRRSTAAGRNVILALLVLLSVPLGASSVDARAGGAFSFGSRGSRTFSMPAPTATAPRAAQPMQRTETPRSTLGTPGVGTSTQPGRFGFGSGLAAGLLGAGLFGMLAGHGFFGGIGDLASLLGLVFQVALIGGLILLGLRLFRARSASAPAFADFGTASRSRASSGGPSGLVGGMGARPSSALAIEARDYAAFERALVDIQFAYGQEDFHGLSRLTTPEMLREFGGQIEQNRTRGLRNEVSDAHLLQGDLSEAWREGSTDYATVAMRFTVRDRMVESASGRVISGDTNLLTEATELWTFRRDRGGPWVLSAIQQTG